MKIQTLLALVATVPAVWLAVSFAIPAEPTDAYVSPMSVVKASHLSSPQVGMGVERPGIVETP